MHQDHYVTAYGDLDGMYTNIAHDRMDEALESNIERLRKSSMLDRRFPLRNLDRVSVGRRKTKQKWNALPAYNHHEQVEITFEQMKAICRHSNESSYMQVGHEIRHYHMGTPMGEQGSSAKANGLCLDDELQVDALRESEHGDSERNLSLAFVDDKAVRVAYDGVQWSRSSAEEYASGLMTYSDPLVMIPEPAAPTTHFLETLTHNPTGNGAGCYTTQKLRPWHRASYRICKLGVAGTADMQVATATATFMRLIDNSTYDNDAVRSIAIEMQEMICGVGWSKSKVWSAFLRLTRRQTHVETSNRYIQFYQKHWQALQVHLANVMY